MRYELRFRRHLRRNATHLEIVFDYFHVVKNFNDKVISAVKSARICRNSFAMTGILREQSHWAECKYILTSKKKH